MTHLSLRRLGALSGPALHRERGRLRRESGQINVFLVGAVVVICVIAVTATFLLGDANADRRSADTAADAAALAAADDCADALEEAYSTAMKAPNGWVFWAAFGRPVSFYCGGSSVAATRYAKENDASVTSYAPLGPNRFRVSVRMNDKVEKTSIHATATSVAQMGFRSGACVSLGMFGIKAGGVCQTSPTMFNPETGEPLRPLFYKSKATIKTRLVHS